VLQLKTFGRTAAEQNRMARCLMTNIISKKVGQNDRCQVQNTLKRIKMSAICSLVRVYPRPFRREVTAACPLNLPAREKTHDELSAQAAYLSLVWHHTIVVGYVVSCTKVL